MNEDAPNEEAVCEPGGNYGLCKTHPTCEMVYNRLVLVEAGILYLRAFAERVAKSEGPLATEASGLLQALAADGNISSYAEWATSKRSPASARLVLHQQLQLAEQSAREEKDLRQRAEVKALEAQVALGQEVCRADRLAALLKGLVAVGATCQTRNTPEWMRYLSEKLNQCLDALGEAERVQYEEDTSRPFIVVKPWEQP